MTNPLDVLVPPPTPVYLNEHTSPTGTQKVIPSKIWSTVGRLRFTRSYFGNPMVWIRRTGCHFTPRAREKKSCGSHGDEIRFLLSSHSATSHRQRAPMHAMLRPPYLPAFPQGTSRLLIFCSQEAVDIHPLITPSSRLYSIRGQTKQTMFFRDWGRSRNGI